MADDHGASREAQKGVLEGAQRVDVEIVGRLVEEQDVATAAEHLGQEHPVALPARELSHLLLLVAALEAEPGHVGAAVQLAPAHDQAIRSPGDLLEDRRLRRQRLARLVDVGQLDRRPDGQDARVRLLLADDHPEEGGLAGAVGPDDADDAAGREVERQPVDQQAVAEAP